MNELTIADIITEAGVRKVAKAAGVQPATAHYWKEGLPTPTGPKAQRRRDIERAIAKASGRPVAEIRRIAMQDDKRRILEHPPETLGELLRIIGLGRVAEVCVVSYGTARRWVSTGLPEGGDFGTRAANRREAIEMSLASTSGLSHAEVARLAREHGRPRKGRVVDMGTGTGTTAC